MKLFVLKTLLFFIFSLLQIFPVPASAQADINTVKIGVLAFRSQQKTLERWSETAVTLSKVIQGHAFEIIPMNYPQINQSVERATIDFILTNTGHYVELETKHGIVRIATLVKSINNQPVKVFGGVIFTRSDRSDINTLIDLKEKSFLAVKKSSLGGFQVAWEQLAHQQMDPFSDFSRIVFNGMPHDEVVLKVLNNEADAGTVRTSIIEQMAKEGTININDIKIIHQQQTKGFPYIHSTQLYPEWPFARLSHTSDDLVEQVTIALLGINKNHPAAIAGKYDRWIPPLDYSSVHQMFRTLKIGPYTDFGKFTVTDVFQKYTVEILMGLFITFIIIIALIRIVRLNTSLKKALSEIKTLQGFLPICASCKKIRDDKGYWNQLETYIEKRSDALFSHSICPTCSNKLYGDDDWYKEIQKNKIE